MPLLSLLLLIPSTLWRYDDFQDEPSLKTGWRFFSWILLWVFWHFLAFRQFCTAQVVSVRDDEIQFQTVSFSRVFPAEIVTTVTVDPIAFHIYSKKDQMTLSRKRVPIELAQCLNGHIAANKEAPLPLFCKCENSLRRNRSTSDLNLLLHFKPILEDDRSDWPFATDLFIWCDVLHPDRDSRESHILHLPKCSLRWHLRSCPIFSNRKQVCHCYSRGDP